MASGIYWQGKVYDLPTAAATVDSTDLNRTPIGGAGRLAIIGEFTGLIQPKTAKLVMSDALAKKLIHPSATEMRKAVEFAFDPTPGSEVPGASEVYLVPVNPATRATKDITVATLDSYLYGLAANQVKYKIEAGTTAGKKLTVAYQDNTEVFDNITRPSFSIVYTGSGSAATMAITPTAATHTLTTTVTGASDNLSLDLNVYTTIQSLVDAINATGKYTAVVLTDRPKDELTMQLDAVTAQDIMTVYTAKSELQAFVDKVNNESGYMTATRKTDAGAAPSNVDWTYLAGAVNGTTQNSDWQSAFDLLKTMAIDLVVPLTSSSSIHTMADTYCDAMNVPDSVTRPHAFVGGAIQTWASEANRTTAVAALKTAAKALNSDRTMHVGLGVKAYDEAGKIKTWPAYVTAALYAGIAAGGRPTLPLTRKYLRVLGLEVDLRKEEITELLRGGVAVPIPDLVEGAGYVISRQVTTWLQDDNLYRVEFSVSRGCDYTAIQVLRAHNRLVGREGEAGFEETLLNATNSILQQQQRERLIRAYDKTKTVIRAEGDARFVDYEAEPVLPINWIFSTYHPKLTAFTFRVQ